MKSKLAVSYAAGFALLYQMQSFRGGEALDLACGPGHFTLCLARYLGYDKVTGIDYAPAMIEQGRVNAAEYSLSKVARFEVGDVTNLCSFPNKQFALTCFNNAAHHMGTLETVRGVLQEMSRITRSDGLILIMDLARLRTASITEKYVDAIADDYLAMGLDRFMDEFRQSMYAAWITDELFQSIPQDSHRVWAQFVPLGLPLIQIILGLPCGREKMSIRQGVPWHRTNSPVPKTARFEWCLLRLLLRLQRESSPNFSRITR